MKQRIISVLRILNHSDETLQINKQSTVVKNVQLHLSKGEHNHKICLVFFPFIHFQAAVKMTFFTLGLTQHESI